MKHKLTLSALMLMTASALLVLTASAAGSYGLDWWSVDGGGGSSSDGATYDLTGTIGQPDAGPAMIGGTYTLTGGFMAGVGGPTSPTSVTISGNAGIDGATLSYDDGGPQTTNSDPDGNYTLTVPYNWTGTVTPSKTDYVFTPDHRDYASVTTDLPDENYAAEKQTPSIARVFPAEDSTSCRKPQVGVDLLLTDLVRTAGGSFKPSTITLELDGANVTSQARNRVGLTSPASRATILYQPGLNLALGTHEAQFTHPSPGGPVTYTWSFTAADISCTN